MTLEEIKAVLDALGFDHQGDVDKGISVWRRDQDDHPAMRLYDFIPVDANQFRQSLTAKVGEGLGQDDKGLIKKWTHKFAHGGIAVRAWWYRQ